MSSLEELCVNKIGDIKASDLNIISEKVISIKRWKIMSYVLTMLSSYHYVDIKFYIKINKDNTNIPKVKIFYINRLSLGDSLGLQITLHKIREKLKDEYWFASNESCLPILDKLRVIYYNTFNSFEINIERYQPGSKTIDLNNIIKFCENRINDPFNNLNEDLIE